MRTSLRLLTMLSRWQALTARERILYAEAMLFLLWAEALVYLVPVRHWRASLTGSPEGGASLALLRDIKRAVERAARHAPMPAKCLSQALAAAWMLRRRGVAGTIKLGAARGPEGALAFHAWLTVGPHIVTGAVGEEAFALLRPAPGQLPRP